MSKVFIDGELVNPPKGRKEPPDLIEMGAQALVGPTKWEQIKDDDYSHVTVARELHQCLLKAGCLPGWIFIEDWERVMDKEPPFYIGWERIAWGLKPMNEAEKERAAAIREELAAMRESEVGHER